MTEPRIEETVGFCRALRDRGLAVTLSETVDAVRTLSLIDPDDRLEAFLSLRSVLTSRREDYPVFEELFDRFWNRIGTRAATRPLADRQALTTSDSPSGEYALKGLALLGSWGTTALGGTDRTSLPGASATALTAENDLSRFATDDPAEVGRVARRIARRLAASPSRRWKPVRRGERVHLRRSLRRSLRSGGELLELSFKRRKQKKTRLVIICDVSGSMDQYSRLLLQFVYGLQNSLARVESFAFSTRLERITGRLKHQSYRQAVHSLSKVAGWSGGTLIGPSLARFNSDWLSLVDKRTVVIILSDGWDTGEPELLAASLVRLRARAGRLIWLNPLLGSATYQPLTRGMQAALPHIDVFAPAHNLASLRALESHLLL